MRFQPYPFEKLQSLISDIPAPENTLKLTIGEPQFQTPQNIQNALKDSTQELRYYPKSKGEDYLYHSILDFISKRFKISMQKSQILPTLGTREVLFTLPQFLLFDIKDPKMAYPNPFYQIYEGASIASRAKSILMPLTKQNNFKPHLSKQDMQQVNLVILNSPNNPTGATLSLDELKQWVEYALEYNFILINDECYSEIYQNTPPASILEASIALGNHNFKNILALNSISKRLSAPGLRSGFIAGDEDILSGYLTYRTYLGTAMSQPLQRAASIAWKSHDIAESIRLKYAHNLTLAQDTFKDTEIFPYSFYVWLYVGDDESFSKALFKHTGILSLPGSYLGREGLGKEYVRLALVYESDILKSALKQIQLFRKDFLANS